MTTTTDAPSSGSSYSAPARSTPGFHWAFFGLLILAAIAILFLAGVFKRNPRVALVVGETAYWDLVIEGANEAAKQYDVKLTVLRAKPDEASQSQTIRDLMGKKYDGVAVSPVNPETQVVLLAELANDTTVVTMDSDSPLSRRLCFVGTDNYTAGRLCGEYVRRAVPDGGEVLISISNLEKENGQRRRQGVIDELLDRPFEREHPMDPPDAPPLKGEKYTVITTLIDHADPAAATDLIAKALAANPNVKCVIGLNAYSAPSALKALEQAKKLGEVKIVGFDNAKETISGIEAGNVYATIVQDQFGAGFHTVRILAENARGDKSGLPMFARRTLPVEVVDRDSVGAGNVQQQLNPATAPSAGAR
jgi:ribose transport system substrate-binding protein